MAVAHHERSLIWKDVSHQPPDIFLSLGTGYHDQIAADTTVPGELGRSSSAISNRSKKEEVPPLLNLRTLSTFQGKIWNTTHSQFDGTFNCTRIWNTFHQDILSGPHYRHRQRYIRLDPDLGFHVPMLDAVHDLEKLQQSVAAHSKLKNHARIKEVAHRLVASTFFFEKYDSTTMEQDGKWECDGKLTPRRSF